ncbi:hypothetical protein KEM54_003961 [Ascosphaera aggregata]|nr:hypothetical protein KEM54_003961 [Ascosphaera aggregata]
MSSREVADKVPQQRNNLHNRREHAVKSNLGPESKCLIYGATPIKAAQLPMNSADPRVHNVANLRGFVKRIGKNKKRRHREKQTRAPILQPAKIKMRSQRLRLKRPPPSRIGGVAVSAPIPVPVPPASAEGSWM